MGRPKKKTDTDDLIEDLELDEESSSLALAEGRTKAQKYIDGDLDSPDAQGDLGQGSGLLDPDTMEELDELEVESVTNEEIAEKIDLASMAGKKKNGRNSFEHDVFEDWVKMSLTYKPLPGAETRAWVEMAHGSDPEAVAMAEDKLIRHNVLWIVKCLQRQAGRDIMSRPNETRNELLSLGRWGFLTGIRKFDRVKAGKNNTGVEANLLTYTKFWIVKYVSEFLGRERYGLKEEAALDRNKALKARTLLQKEMDREPTYEEIAKLMAAQAETRAKGKGKLNPTRDQLRRRGAISPERVKELLSHVTQTISIDAPVGDSEDSPSISDYVRDEASNANERMEGEEAYEAIMSRLALVPDARKRMEFRMIMGLRSESGSARLPVFNKTEVAMFAGRTRDSITAHEEDVRNAIWGEACVDPIEQRWLRPGPAVPPSIKEDVCKLVDLRALAKSEGLRLDAALPVGLVSPSPFGSGGNLEVRAESWHCQATGLRGNLFDWLEARRGLTAPEAFIEGVRLTFKIPAGVQKVTVDKSRANRMDVHR